MYLQVTIILPEELLDTVTTDIVEKLAPVAYSRVIMSLEAIVEGEFFNEYIKKGVYNLI
jgi:ribonuclease P/MRP protein subunit RPP40